MNYYGAKELADSFRTVRQNTIQTAEEHSRRPVRIHLCRGNQDIARTLVHIALSPQLQLTIHAGERRTSFEGFDFPRSCNSSLKRKPRIGRRPRLSNC